VVLGSSSTALALGRRIRDVGGHAVHVDTERPAGGIATRSRAWTAKHRGARGPDALRLLARLGAERDHLAKPFLLGTGDEDLWFIAEHRDELDARFDVLHPSNGAMITCLDKARFQRFCDAHGVPAPSWFVCRAHPDDIRRDVKPSALPLVARFASRSRGRCHFPKMFRLDTPADIDALVDLLPGALRPDDELLFSESLLHRDLVRYSVAFCRARHTCIAFEAVKERPSAATGDVGTYVTITDAPEARALALRAAEALDYYGMGEMEVFLDRASSQYYAIEINARPWLQLGMEPLAGTDFLGFLAGHSPGTVGTRRHGAAWIDVVGDLFWRYSRTARGTGTGERGGYLRSLMRARAFKYFALGDPGPAVFEASRWVRRTIVRRR
jgi:predicted ATP-grasp superfamily ATP-dependent carboligase